MILVKLNEIEQDWGSFAVEICLVIGHQAHLLVLLYAGAYQLFSQIVSVDHLCAQKQLEKGEMGHFKEVASLDNG